MSLSVGTDSYVTLAEAEELISSYFTSSDGTRKVWNNTSSADKEVALRKSCRAINNLEKSFSGRRKNSGQTMAFPRVKTVIAGVYALPFVSQIHDNWIDQSAYASDGIQEAKLAQVVNAVYSLSLAGARDSALDVNVRGLTSRRVGPTSETYNTKNQYSSDIMIGIYTKEVYAILNAWVGGTRYSL